MYNNADLTWLHLCQKKTQCIFCQTQGFRHTNMVWTLCVFVFLKTALQFMNQSCKTLLWTLKRYQLGNRRNWKSICSIKRCYCGREVTEQLFRIKDTKWSMLFPERRNVKESYSESNWSGNAGPFSLFTFFERKAQMPFATSCENFATANFVQKS